MNILCRSVIWILCLFLISCTRGEETISQKKSSEFFSSAQVIGELVVNRDYWGPVIRGASDTDKDINYIATRAAVYMVQDSNVKVISKRPEGGEWISLAPGGKVYAWTISDPQLKSLFIISLFDISGKKLADLKLKEKPYGFGGLYLGYQGNIIITVTALDDWQGIDGRFKYVFWDKEGAVLNEVVLNGRYNAVLDSLGKAIVFLGKKEAVAYSSYGKELWQVRGHYRKAAITKGGELALLNPGNLKQINEVHLVVKGKKEEETLIMPTPVHRLVFSPNGVSAVVVGDKGRYFILDPINLKFKENPRLPLKGDHYIFHTEYANPNTIAFGVLHRQGDPPKETWPMGSMVVVDLKGASIFNKTFPVREATTKWPAINATYGSHNLVGFTKDRVVFLKLENNSGR